MALWVAVFPKSIAALQIQDQEQLGRLLLLRVAVLKIALTLLALCCSASVGHEGSTVQIDASIMYSLRRFSHFTHQDQMRVLIVAGGAAGVAADFNTLLAGFWSR